MSDETKVWIRSRKCKSGKTTHHLRWIDPIAHKWKSRKAGTDRKRAEREAATLEKQLAEGSYSDIRKTTWAAFIAEHVERIPGKRNAVEAERTLKEFGDSAGNVEPRRVTYAMIESFVEAIKAKGNTPATVNKKLRYLRAAFNRAIKRGYLAKNPMSDWQWEAEQENDIREVSPAEETTLLATADDLHGSRWKGFIQAATGTGGRRGELLALTWENVSLDRAEVFFTHTKAKRNRGIPINPDLVEVLRKLHVQTQSAGGPFIGMADNLGREWGQIVRKAGLVVKSKDVDGKETTAPTVSIHDLRRTYITRLIRAGVPLPTVQQLAGHSDIKVTLKYYNRVGSDDLRTAVAKLRTAAVG